MNSIKAEKPDIQQVLGKIEFITPTDINIWYEQLLRKQIAYGLKPLFQGDQVIISNASQHKYDINIFQTFEINLPVPTETGLYDITKTLYLGKESFGQALIYQFPYCDLDIIYQAPSTVLLEKLLRKSNSEIEEAMKKRGDL